MKTGLNKLFLLLLVLLMALLVVACTPESEEGQESDITPATEETSDDDSTEEASIEFSGEITSINGTVIVVNGLNVETSSAALTGLLEPGATVRVEGILQPNAVIVALIIIVEVELTPEATAPAEATAEATQPSPESTPIVDDDAIIIVIEGPVEAININIITIYGVDIVLSPDDPLLTVIQIGDVIRIEGAMGDGDGVTIIIIAITIIFIDVDVFVLDGAVWRDDGSCQNGPPPWAPANGWRRRCESGGRGGSGGSGGRGRGGSGGS
jgi:hypothetical protein